MVGVLLLTPLISWQRVCTRSRSGVIISVDPHNDGVCGYISSVYEQVVGVLLLTPLISRQRVCTSGGSGVRQRVIKSGWSGVTNSLDI